MMNKKDYNAYMALAMNEMIKEGYDLSRIDNHNPKWYKEFCTHKHKVRRKKRKKR